MPRDGRSHGRRARAHGVGVHPLPASRPGVTAPVLSSRVALPRRVGRRSGQATCSRDVYSSRTANLSRAPSSFSGRQGRTVMAHAGAVAFARIAQEDSGLRDPCPRPMAACRTFTSPSSTLPMKSSLPGTWFRAVRRQGASRLCSPRSCSWRHRRLKVCGACGARDCNARLSAGEEREGKTLQGKISFTAREQRFTKRFSTKLG